MKPAHIRVSHYCLQSCSSPSQSSCCGRSDVGVQTRQTGGANPLRRSEGTIESNAPTFKRGKASIQGELQIAELTLGEHDGRESFGFIVELLTARCIACDQVLEDAACRETIRCVSSTRRPITGPQKVASCSEASTYRGVGLPYFLKNVKMVGKRDNPTVPSCNGSGYQLLNEGWRSICSLGRVRARRFPRLKIYF
jgi:hypothetical protein